MRPRQFPPPDIERRSSGRLENRYQLHFRSPQATSSANPTISGFFSTSESAEIWCSDVRPLGRRQGEAQEGAGKQGHGQSYRGHGLHGFRSL